MNEIKCDHLFSRYSIAMVGIRWMCDKCNLIAPACFTPIPQATSAYRRVLDNILDNHLN
jgi:hypothetical protein